MRTKRLGPAIIVMMLSTTSCGVIHTIGNALVSDYHHVTFGGDGGVPNAYLTLQRHATGCMKWAFNICKVIAKKSDAECGTTILQQVRGIVAKKLTGDALGIWNGKFGVPITICAPPFGFPCHTFTYHPNLGKGFADKYGSALAAAIHELDSQHHDCLVSDWTPGGASWKTVPDAGHAECDWGSGLSYQGKVCDEQGIH